MAGSKEQKTHEEENPENRPRSIFKSHVVQPKRMQVPWAATVGCVGCVVGYAHPLTGVAIAICGWATGW
jgi:hypothetical protein